MSSMGDITSLATDLLSGNIENNEGFMGLIKTVSENVKGKIEGGEIDVEELFISKPDIVLLPGVSL